QQDQRQQSRSLRVGKRIFAVSQAGCVRPELCFDDRGTSGNIRADAETSNDARCGIRSERKKSCPETSAPSGAPSGPDTERYSPVGKKTVGNGSPAAAGRLCRAYSSRFLENDFHSFAGQLRVG